MSRVWASVTPVVLNRHFDGDDRWEQSAESVKNMCVDDRATQQVGGGKHVGFGASWRVFKRSPRTHRD